MPEICVLPRFSVREAAAAAKKLYGLEGHCRQLNGERDLNYRFDGPGGRYLFKIANAAEKIGLLECQHQVFERLAQERVFEQAPACVKSLAGKRIETVTAADGARHYARVVGYVEGRLLASVNPHTPELLESLGERLALLDKSLAGFTHAALDRPLLWEMHRADAVAEDFAPLLASAEQRALVDYFTGLFRAHVLPSSAQLRRGVIHNDANDHNVLVAGDGPWNQRVISIIDYGDMTVSWLVADAAIAAAYAMLGKARPLEAAASVIRGYHRKHPLNEAEFGALFALMCMRLALSVCICAHQRALEPGNDYLGVSAQPAWNALRLLRDVSPRFAHFTLRAACGLEAVPNSPAVVRWFREQKRFSPLVDIDFIKDPLLILDASVGSPDMDAPGQPVDPEVSSRRLFRAIEDHACVAAIGRYAEYRLIYTGERYTDATGHRRTLHLGVDIFLPAGSRVFAPLEGVVHSTANHDAPLDYGGTLILAHRAAGASGRAITFYTLYGHLAPASLHHLEKGAAVKAGQPLARLGDIHENGNWPPHVHFQIITDLPEEADTFAGVGAHAHREVWLSLCPDPNAILGIPNRKLAPERAPERAQPTPALDREAILAARRRSLNPSLSLAYRAPIHAVRGAMQYLYDATGRQYLDAVNNVSHVGHCHPQVVAAERRQAGVLNTNTRYLYAAIAEYAERLLQTFPEPLCVCCLVCSGSEANDLALRMARCHTGRRGVVVLEHAYHGNLSALIEVSPYKHDGKGGEGTPGHVYAAIPDGYRGQFKDDEKDAAVNYAKDVQRALQDASANGGAAAFLAESVLGCAGQVVLPDGYLKAAYAHARRAGAVCIADEVQAGFGRAGSHFWGFETQGREVIPDIVTLGKPIGNGHPMAAVITTREIAESFDNGMEYFNTFGGNPVSCAVGHAVLDVIEEEGLQENALRVGAELRAGLGALQSRFPLLGDVRGLGLFIGVELVNDRESLAPARGQAEYIAERMKQEGVLIGTDGPSGNVLKIKPPMCFSAANVGVLVDALEMILGEDFAQPGSAERGGGCA